jgi:hypothetical protein
MRDLSSFVSGGVKTLFRTDKAVSRPYGIPLPLAVWYDAADTSTITVNGSLIAQWNDKSGNGRHANVGASFQPNYGARTLKGITVPDWPNGQKWLDSSWPTQNRETTYFIVGRIDALKNYQAVVGNAGSGGTQIVFNSSGQLAVRQDGGSVLATNTSVATNTSTTYIACVKFGASNITLRLQGTEAVVGNSTTFNNATHRLGGDDALTSTSRYDGAFAEFMIYGFELTAGQIVSVENYLSEKWL